MFLTDIFDKIGFKKKYRKILNDTYPVAYVVGQKGRNIMVQDDNTKTCFNTYDDFKKYMYENNLYLFDSTDFERDGLYAEAIDLIYDVVFVYSDTRRNQVWSLINIDEFNKKYHTIAKDEISLFRKVGLMEPKGIMRDPKAITIATYNEYMKILQSDHKAYKIKGSNQPVWYFKVNGKLIKSNTPIWNEFIALGGNSETITDWMLEEVE